MREFLAATPVIDWDHPTVRECAQRLRRRNPVSTAKRCFQFVCDHILHTGDHGLDVITCRASDVLQRETGYCFAKSHLLAALLRANEVPAGFCYQLFPRTGDGPPFALHGLNAAYLPGHGWYRMDARGNRWDVRARFSPPRERLAFPLEDTPGSCLSRVYPMPLADVVTALTAVRGVDTVLEGAPVRVCAMFGNGGAKSVANARHDSSTAGPALRPDAARPRMLRLL